MRFLILGAAAFGAALSLSCGGVVGSVPGGGAAPAPGGGPETIPIPDSGVSFAIVPVPAGSLRLQGGREVTFRPFRIGKCEVSWAEYSLYYEGWKQGKVDGISRPTQPDVIDPREPFPDGGEQTDRHPAIGLGWFGLLGYCEWLSYKTGRLFRLPTEAEWEYACRAGATGEAPADLDAVAWHKGNSRARTHPVGTKKPNAWGIHDMLGNAMEYCLEPYEPPGHIGVLRGGAWNVPPEELKFGARQKVLLDKWLERDPKWPLRAWWLTDAPFTGLRVVCPEDDGVSAEARKAAAARLEVRDVRIVQEGKRPFFMDRIRGEIVWKGDRTLDEVELLVYFRDEAGKPLLKDPRDKPSFNKCWPVMPHAFHPGPHAAPLRPGESRVFEVEVPHPFDEVGPLETKSAGARACWVHFAR